MKSVGKVCVRLVWPESIDKFESAFIEDRVFARVNVSWSGSALAAATIFEVTNTADGFAGVFEGEPVGHIQLSNEGLKPVHFGSHRPKLALRNYFDPRYGPSGAIRTFCIPLGYKRGFGAREYLSRSTRRLLLWSFVGDKKGSRARIIDLFRELGTHSLHWTSSWSDPGALSPAEVKEIYQESSFVICPWGYLNPDSFRLTEALECGAIPVTVKFCGLDYARAVFGPHPFIVGNNWRDAAREVKWLSERPEKLEAKRSEIERWYKTFLASLSSDMEALISDPVISLSSLQGEQWRIQLRWARNPIVRAVFFLYFRFWWFRKFVRPI